jgi:hypothetical protein
MVTERGHAGRNGEQTVSEQLSAAEKLRRANADVRQAFEGINADESLREYWPSARVAFAALTALLDGLERCIESEERRAALLLEYEQIRMSRIGNDPATRTVREMLTFHSQARLKLIQIVACEDREKAIAAGIGAAVEQLLIVATDLFDGPLVSRLPPSALFIPHYMTPEQLRTLVNRFPNIDWQLPPIL